MLSLGASERIVKQLQSTYVPDTQHDNMECHSAARAAAPQVTCMEANGIHTLTSQADARRYGVAVFRLEICGGDAVGH